MKPGSDPKVREITCKRWFLRKTTAAIVLYPWIFYRGDLTVAQRYIIRKHEWVHVEQIHRIGWLRFYVTYLWYSMRYGYRNNPLEVEAYQKQNL